MRLLPNTDKQWRQVVNVEGLLEIPSYRRRGLLRPMLSFRGVFCLLSGLVAFVNSKSSAGDSVLVVVEPNHRDNYSIFFDGLKGELPRVVFGACH
jgi:hypothetical protein